MFTVQPVCRAVIISLYILLILLINILAVDTVLAVVSCLGLLWLVYYFSTLKISIVADCLIKQNGKIFHRKSIIMLKNISALQIVSLHPSLPALIRLQTYSRSLFIIGLNGRQRQALEYYLFRLK